MDKKKSVLAIDDDAVQLKLYRNILHPEYDIWTVNSASNALNFMNSNVVDVIILDIAMPNITGFDFLYDIRKIPTYMKVPIIIVSGKGGQDFFAEARNSSAFDVLTKPVEPEQLVSVVEKALAAE